MVPKLTGQCWGSPLADVPGKPCTPWVPLEAICYYITVTSYVIVFFLGAHSEAKPCFPSFFETLMKVWFATYVRIEKDEEIVECCRTG